MKTNAPPHTHTPLLVKRVNWGYLYTPIQTGTFECGYTPAYWGYTKYECDYTPITWGYPNTPSMGDMLLNAFIWHFRSHAGNAQMGTSPWQCVHVSLGRIRCVPPIYTFYKRTHTHPSPTPHSHTYTFKFLHRYTCVWYLVLQTQRERCQVLCNADVCEYWDYKCFCFALFSDFLIHLLQYFGVECNYHIFINNYLFYKTKKQNKIFINLNKGKCFYFTHWKSIETIETNHYFLIKIK